jgi:hypothetical protein
MRWPTWSGPAASGCQLPREFPPFTTVQHYFYAWRDGGVLQRINFELLRTRPVKAALRSGGGSGW